MPKNCSECGNENRVYRNRTSGKLICCTCYRKSWLLSNKAKRNRYRKGNYEQTRRGALNKYRRWLPEELNKITAADRPTDRVLAHELGRSVLAIQIQRYRAKFARSLIST